MQKYTEVITLKLTLQQKQTLQKLKARNIKVASFIRAAIADKITAEKPNLMPKPKPIYCPF